MEVKPISKRTIARLKREYRKAGNSGTEIIADIRNIKNGELSITSYAVNLTKTYGWRISAIVYSRTDEDGYYTRVSANLWHIRWYFNEIEWSGLLPFAGWGKGDDYNPHIESYIGLENIKKSRYKYCSFAEYKKSGGEEGLAEYIRLYSNHFKQVELMSKAGLGSLVCPSFVSKAEKDKVFRSFVRQSIEQIDEQTKPMDVINAYRTGEDIETEMMIRHIVGNRNTHGAERKRVTKYLLSKKISYAEWDNYLRACEYCGVDIDESVLFPSNFDRTEKNMLERQAKNREIAREKEKEEFLMSEREYEQKLNRLNELLASAKIRLSYRVWDYSAVMLVTEEDFKREGNEMHNCIGGYYKSSLDGDCYCFAIRDESGKSVANVEFDKKGIRQCYGVKNKQTPKSIRKMAEKVVEIANKEIRKAS